jgi:hypothetical protein
MLNDGWFHMDVIYIISWIRKISVPQTEQVSETPQKKKASAKPRMKKVDVIDTFIGLGQDIPTERESAVYKRRRDVLKQLNSEKDDEPSNLVIYARSANQYKCASRFTTEFSETCFTNVLAFLPNA